MRERGGEKGECSGGEGNGIKGMGKGEEGTSRCVFSVFLRIAY